MPTLKIGLDERTHREFKVWCAERGVAMNEATVSAIKTLTGIFAKESEERKSKGSGKANEG